MIHSKNGHKKKQTLVICRSVSEGSRLTLKRRETETSQALFSFGLHVLWKLITAQILSRSKPLKTKVTKFAMLQTFCVE